MSDNITELQPSWEIVHGDALKVLRKFAPNTFDAVITDPPYASGPTRNIPAWEKARPLPLTATPRISDPGPVGPLNGSMTPARSVNPVPLCACSSIGGNSPQPPMRSSGRGGSGAAQLSGTKVTAVPRRAVSASRPSTLSGVPMGICLSADPSPVCPAYSSTAIPRTASI